MMLVSRSVWVRVAMRPWLFLSLVLAMSLHTFAKAQNKKPDYLKEAKIDPKNSDQLIEFLQSRTLTNAQVASINQLLARLGSESFEERLKASEEVEKLGPGAIGLLRKASMIDATKLNETDFEKAYRAEIALKKLEKIPEASLTRAVLKALVPLSHPKKTETLINFLNVAENSGIKDDIQAVLLTVAAMDGKANPAILELLKSPLPERRVMATMLLLQGGPAEKRIRIPEGYERVREAAKNEADPETKYAMVFALASIPRDTEAISQLLDMLPNLERCCLWQVEDFFRALAGPATPDITLGNKATIQKFATTWREWWAKDQGKIDLDKWTYQAKIQGKLLLVTQTAGVNSSTIQELNQHMGKQWSFNHPLLIYDAVPLPDGNILIADQNRMMVKETSGTLVNAYQITGTPQKPVYGSPQNLTIKADGSVLITLRNGLVLTKISNLSEHEVVVHRNNYDICGAERLPNGEFAVMVQNTNGGNAGEHLIFYDKTGKEITDRKIKTGPPSYLGGLVAINDDRVLVPEQLKVAEYDIKTKKAVWSKEINSPLCVQRLPNGNTLILDGSNSGNGSNRLMEVDSKGNEVWSYSPTPGQRIARAYLR
jgi:outer membrane protein assembly factor BamB